ncbi:MAG: transposase [Planctomycetes bacterium]|nr:transposase [Planctomycetota bacterium]
MPTLMDAKTKTLERLAGYAESFRDLFSRPEQVRWLSFYLWGLIETTGRRSIEAIARAIPADALPSSASPGQALQHFLTRSAWDEQKLLKRLRERLESLGEAGSSWVIHEAVFLKRGQHSVGVHRQYLRDHGVKANSQTAVLISQVGPSGYVPLALRLYLPRGWFETARPTQLSEIPNIDRQPQSKDMVARRLLEELVQDERRPDSIILANGFASAPELVGSVKALGIEVVEDAKRLSVAENGRDWLKSNLGLDHFEGRSWRGWHHHAASVLAAYGFLTLEESDRLPKRLNVG